jgi:hypothetical protein
MQRTERIVAIFDTTKAADAAIQDLGTARIPSLVVQRGSGTIRGELKPCAHPFVTAVVEERHADFVASILDQYGRLGVLSRPSP